MRGLERLLHARARDSNVEPAPEASLSSDSDSARALIATANRNGAPPLGARPPAPVQTQPRPATQTTAAAVRRRAPATTGSAPAAANQTRNARLVPTTNPVRAEPLASGPARVQNQPPRTTRTVRAATVGIFRRRRSSSQARSTTPPPAPQRTSRSGSTATPRPSTATTPQLQVALPSDQRDMGPMTRTPSLVRQ